MDAFFGTLPGVFEAIDASDEVRRAFVFAAWKRVAGAQLTERTAPIDLVNGRLRIAVPDVTWQRNLESLAGQLLFRLNATLGRPLVEYIEFRIDAEAVESAQPEAGTPDTEPRRGNLPTEIFESAANIKDDQLRKAVLNAAANCLSRGKE